MIGCGRDGDGQDGAVQREVGIRNIPAYRIHRHLASIPLLDIAIAAGCCSRDIANVF